MSIIKVFSRTEVKDQVQYYDIESSKVTGKVAT